MHGLIHIIFKNFVVDSFGLDAWKEIMKRAGITDEASILKLEQYDDKLTLAAISIGCEVAGAPLETALEMFGGYFVEFAAKSGFLILLKSLGSNLFEFLSNLNILHHNIERDFSSAIFPLFEVQLLEGEAVSGQYKFRLFYGSDRPGLDPLLKGALQKTSSVLFASELDIDDVSGSQSHIMNGDMSVQLVYDISVRPKVIAKQSQQEGTSSFGFFDFHAALASLWSCSCKCSDNLAPLEVNLAPLVGHDLVKVSESAWVQQVSQTLQKKQAEVDQICEAYSFADPKMHLYFQMDVVDRAKVAGCLFRTVEASHISAPWTDETKLSQATHFWEAYEKLDSFYNLSADGFDADMKEVDLIDIGKAKEGKVRFLSQSWAVPDGWDAIMGTHSSYAQAKAAEICCIAKEIAAREFDDAAKWENVRFWLDKCCIPQGDKPLMEWCVNLLEEFIVYSDGLIVLVPWTYFTRLWCVYEWVCFLLIHDPIDIEICADPFIRDSTVHLYLEAIAQFQVESCKCFNESDRVILLNKVQMYYKSLPLFERFLKFSAIALFARCIASRRSGKPGSSLQPWRNLARSCGFALLANKLDDLVVQLPKWRSKAASQAQCGATKDVQLEVGKQVDSWFKSGISPMIAEERDAVASHEGLLYIKNLRAAVGMSKMERWLSVSSLSST